MFPFFALSPAKIRCVFLLSFHLLPFLHWNIHPGGPQKISTNVEIPLEIQGTILLCYSLLLHSSRFHTSPPLLCQTHSCHHTKGKRGKNPASYDDHCWSSEKDRENCGGQFSWAHGLEPVSRFSSWWIPEEWDPASPKDGHRRALTILRLSFLLSSISKSLAGWERLVPAHKIWTGSPSGCWSDFFFLPWISLRLLCRKDSAVQLKSSLSITHSTTF